ncbi:MAG TPA: hypothetical protein VGE47_13080 [Burkholderiaceae bacterium]
MLKSAWPLIPIVVAGLSLATPAAAQYWNNDYNYGWPANPNNPNFDPAAAAINALNTSFPRSRAYSTPVDFSLIDAMERGDVRAYSTHRTRCAARYVTYSASTDMFISNSGKPKRCKL